jgi:alcohol dehydrogenase
MAHSLGGYSDLPHGECNALLLENVIDFNYDSSQVRYDAIGRIMNAGTGLRTDGKKSVIAGIRAFRESLGVTDTLADLGVSKKDIPDLAKKAIRDPCLATNPKKLTLADLELIYEKAL